MNIGLKIKKLREERGWSQRQLGRYSGLSGSYITMLEQNRSQPSLKALSRIAKAFAVDLSDMIDETFKLKQRAIVTADGEKLVLKEQPERADHETKSEAIISVTQKLSSLDLEDVRAVSRIVHKLAAHKEMSTAWSKASASYPVIYKPVKKRNGEK